MRLAAISVLALATLSSAACYRTKAVNVADAPADTRAWVTLSDQSVVLAVRSANLRQKVGGVR